MTQKRSTQYKMCPMLLGVAALCVAVSCSNSGANTVENQDSESESSQQETDPDSDTHTMISTDAFSIVVLPDTQHYVAWKRDMFVSQIEWIIANAQERNIQFVAHVGDIVHSFGTEPEEWTFASELLEQLNDADIPFGVIPGNHDYDDSDGGRSNVMYNDFFPISTFSSMSTYGGAYEDDKSDNTFHVFELSGIKMLVLLLEFGPRDGAIDWANDIVASYPDHLVSLVTHGYLNEENELLGPDHTHSPTNGYGLGDDANNGEDMWNNLVFPNDINFVYCGHTGNSEDGPDDATGLLIDNNSRKNPVYQMMSNYQYSGLSTDNGYLRIAEFSPSTNTVDISTYSPYYNRYATDSENQFEISDIALVR